jgi:hypothetical protein
MHLILRGANACRISGQWQHDDERDVGRIYRLDDRPDSQWFWGVSFQLTERKSYGHATTLDAAKAAFKAEYEAWHKGARKRSL